MRVLHGFDFEKISLNDCVMVTDEKMFKNPKTVVLIRGRDIHGNIIQEYISVGYDAVFTKNKFVEIK